MDYYEKNLECIKEYKNSMYHSIQKLDNSKISYRLDAITSNQTRDGQLALTIRYQDKEYRLNSPYNPAKEAERWVEQYSFHSINNVITMFGFGNGIFARALTSRLSKGDTLIIYEPCAELFFHVLKYYDITDLLSNSKVFIAIEGINDFDFHNMLRIKTTIMNIKGVIRCTHPNYDKIFTESNLIFWKELRDIYKTTIIQANTAINFGKVYIENILKNIVYLSESATIFELKESLPKDIPAIVVAAGPSVSSQIEELKKAKGKAVIVAVDRILDFLLDSGIVPDFVFTLDPSKPVEYFSKREDISIPLLSFMASNHQIYRIHKGKKIICNCSDFLVSFYRDIGKVPPTIISSGSVATAAFTACVELGFKNIILVGQDLAYKGDATHAGGIEEKVVSNTDILVEGVQGGMVKSRYDWKEYLTWYEDFLTLFPQVNVIDTKDSGAKIKGTKLMTLEEAIGTYSVGEKDFTINSDFLSKTMSENDIDKLLIHLSNGLDQVNILERKAKEAIKLCDKLIFDSKKNIHSIEIDKNLKKLKNINTLIEEQNIYPLMNYYVQAVSTQKLAEIYHFKDDLTEDSLKTFISSKSIYEAVIEAVDLIRPLLNTAYDDIKSKL